jgi:hypothetical protein
METPPKVLLAVLFCDRKLHFQLTPLDSIIAQDYPNLIPYFNIETHELSRWEPLANRMAKAVAGGKFKNWHYDYWKPVISSWQPKPQFDQDQARLIPICEARNRAIDCAIELRADYLMFVDSDMTIPADAVSRLVARNRPIVGGYVRGRNNHKGAEYIFGNLGGIKPLGDGLVECDHGNIGFCLIRSDVFSVLRFRRGPHCTLGHLQSDDPNFCFDALHKWGFGRHVIDKNVEAKHVDDNKLDFKNGAQF